MTKPCPFCGMVDDHTDRCYFTLKAAGATVGELSAAWNRRATPPSPSTAPTAEPLGYAMVRYGKVQHIERSAEQAAKWIDAEAVPLIPMWSPSTAPTVEVDERDLRMLSHELSGVIADVESGHGFDSICLDTIKRVRAALASKPPAREAAERQSDVISIVKEVAKEMMADLEDQFGRPNEDGEEDAARNYLTGKFAAITMMERGILARIEVRGAAKGGSDGR